MKLHNTMTPDEEDALNKHLGERKRRSGAAPCSVCPDCGSANVRSVRREYGIKGQWNYWWIESMCCSDCGRINIPREPGTPNDQAEP